jgi:hypothetical protein
MQKLLLYFLFIAISSFMLGQEEIPIPEDVPVLEKLVTVDYDWVHIDVVLNSISKQTGAVFSYNSKIINPDELVKVHEKRKSTRFVLKSFLDESIDFKARGKYIILSKKAATAGNNKEEKIYIEGYITDPKTGDKLENATVYDKEHKLSATTDEFGYFKLEVSPSKTITQLHVAKAGYKDTIITRQQSKSDLVTIDMPENRTFNDSVFKAFSNKMQTNVTDGLISVKHWANSVNLNDTFFSKVQVSFLPFIGTNQLLGGNSVNDYSFNILGGYVQGVRYLEMGGLVNIVRNDASYCQLAGWSNIVGGNFKGFQASNLINVANNLDGVQAAGILNVSLGDMRSCQLSGTGNIVGRNANGAQVAGIFSIAKNMSGAQVSGIFCAANEVKGCQVSGIISIADSVNGAQVNGCVSIADNISGFQCASIINVAKMVEAPQVSGVLNVADTVVGTQIAGTVNVASKVKGVQVAGLVNVCDDIYGAQVASLFNVANNVSGAQVSCFNFADSYNYGAPIGLISIVRFGMHSIEISGDEMRFVNLAFKTGVHSFYNIFTFGTKADQNSVWNYGYGIGTIWGNNSRLKKNVECTFLQFQKDENWSYQNTMISAYAGVNIKLTGKIALAIGATFNMFTLDKYNTDYEAIFSKLAPYKLNNKSFGNDMQLQTWVGGKIGLRFF